MLLDSLIALCVVVVCILQMMKLLVGSEYLTQQAQIQNVAANAAEMEIETLRSQSFVNTAAMSSGSFTIPSSVLSTFPKVSMTGTYTVSAVSGLGDSTHKVLQLVVIVTWNRADAKSTTSSVVLDAYQTQGAIS